MTTVLITVAIAAWYGFALWAVPRLMQWMKGERLTSHDDGGYAVYFWLISPAFVALVGMAWVISLAVKDLPESLSTDRWFQLTRTDK